MLLLYKHEFPYHSIWNDGNIDLEYVWDFLQDKLVCFTFCIPHPKFQGKTCITPRTLFYTQCVLVKASLFFAKEFVSFIVNGD